MDCKGGWIVREDAFGIFKNYPEESPAFQKNYVLSVKNECLTCFEIIIDKKWWA